jgi:hypothetical protein
VTAAGSGTAGYSGDIGPATAAELNSPCAVAVDPAGDVFIADLNNNVIREVVQATGDIIAFAGTGTAGYTGDHGPATAAELSGPFDLAFDTAGDLFIADVGNNVVREVVRATGAIITVAGNRRDGYSGDNGLATAAELNAPAGLAVDAAGDLFIADRNNNRIREVVQATGDIVTVAGNGTAGDRGDNGPATAAELNAPNGVAVDAAGDLFIADSGNVVREVVKATGDIITVAGNGTTGYRGDGGPATAAELHGPDRIAIDSAGDVFVPDVANNVVRKFAPAVTVTIVGKSLVIHTQPSSTATAGRAFATQPVVYLVDQNGNLETGDNSTVITVSLASGTGPLQAKTLSATVVGGIATFTGLADNTAETITLKFTGDGLTSGQSNPIVVSPAPPFRLKIQTQPSATATAGQPFAIQPVIEELDQYGNLETTDSSTAITAALSLGGGPLVGTTTAKLTGGVASFTDLADTSVGTIELSFAGGRLSVGPSSAVTLTPPNSPTPTPTPTPATVNSEQPIITRRTNKKGKPVGKAVLVGFTLDYSAAMNPATAGSTANYQITATTTKHVKKKTVVVHTPVALTAAYDPTTNSVRLTIQGKPKFASGGQITVINAPPNGVSSAAGALLDASDTEFTISPKATSITPG